MKSINLTPTWEGILPLLIELAANGETTEARNTAKAELLKIARYADDTPDKIKELNEQAQSAQAMRATLESLDAAMDALACAEGVDRQELFEAMDCWRGEIATALEAAPAKAEPVTVLVYVSGGLVQGTSSNGPASVLILDADTGGRDPEEDANLVTIEGDTVYAYEEGPKVEPERVNAIRQTIRQITENPEA